MNQFIRVAIIYFFLTAFTTNATDLNPNGKYCENNSITPQSIVHSANLILQHFYQNPEAHQLPPYEFLTHGELKGFATVYNSKSKGKNSYVANLGLARSSQYYINCQNAPIPKLCDTPPSYVWGGMGWYERNTNGEFILNLHGNDKLTSDLTKHPGLDCSGFTYAVYSHAKLRVTTDLSKTPSFETADNTPARSYMVLDEKSCFKEVIPEINQKQYILPGDIIVWKTHIIIVNDAGDDPFGINHIQKIKDCNIQKINPEQATLTFFNSKGGFARHSDETVKTYFKNSFFAKSHKILRKNPGLVTGIGMGISKQYIKEFFYTSPKTFFDLAINQCKAKFVKSNSLVATKIIRHRALFNDGLIPCSCLTTEKDFLKLHPLLK